MSDLNNMVLEEMTEIIVDCPHSTPIWTEEGFIVLRNQNIRDGRLNLSNPSFTNEKGYEARVKRAIPKAGDLVFTREAPMGEVCMIPENLTCCLGQRMVLIRPDTHVVDGKYLLFAFQGPNLKHQVSWNEGTGTTVSNIRIPSIKGFSFNLPSLKEQKAIAHILGTLDDKIELNRQMNQTLEAMAQALFKSWFVDFDPVIDNALAVGNPIPEALQARAEKRKALTKSPPEGGVSAGRGGRLLDTNPALAVLFPSSFEYNETLDKWIPEGWEVKGLGEIAHFGNGKTSPERFNDGIYPVYGSNGEIGRTNESNRENIIIIGRVGTYCGSLYYFSGKAWITDNAMFAQAKEISNNLFLFELLKRCNLNDMSTGSGQPLLNQGILKSIDTISPPDEILKHFNRQLSALEFKRTANVEQAETLTQLRDTLLPQLISGKVRVPEELIKK